MPVAVQVRVTPLTTKRVEHSGIKVQLIGQIELASERGTPHDFVSLGRYSAATNCSCCLVEAGLALLGCHSRLSALQKLSWPAHCAVQHDAVVHVWACQLLVLQHSSCTALATPYGCVLLQCVSWRRQGTLPQQHRSH